jgi:hypothetical protein
MPRRVFHLASLPQDGSMHRAFREARQGPQPAIDFIAVSGNIDEAANIAGTDYKRSPYAKTAMKVGSDA